MSQRTIRSWILAATALALGCATASSKPAAKPAAYVFAWPFLEAPIEPRGGTTRGAPVTLDTRPSAAWQKLHAGGLSARERDRAAILAMAGDYRASFDFLETILFAPGAAPARPYRSWGTERIYAIEQRADFISLQHVIVMFAIDDRGRRIGPLVQKHWRQDWRYEPRSVLVFAGNERFETRAVPRAERRGAWSQTVYQVDDSPRYGSVGRWAHSAEASIWEGGEAWRPLPRREHSVRSDYHVLAGRNRHTILPTGWVHEQDNLKLVLVQVSRSEPKASEDQKVVSRSEPEASEDHQVGSRSEPKASEDQKGDQTRRLAREIGVDRYERLRDFDFSAADAYWKATASFWALVRQGWAQRVAKSPRLQVRTSCDGAEAFVPFFALADRIESGEAIPPDAQRAEVERVLDCVTSR